MSINKQKFNRTINAIESIIERENDTETPKRSSPLLINDDAAKQVLNYLWEPYENGYWQMQGDWCYSSPFALELLNQLELINVVTGDAEATPVAIARKMDEKTRNKIMLVTARISSIFTLFSIHERKKIGKKIPELSEQDTWTNNINLPLLEEKFPEAFKIFSEKIYFDTISTKIGQNRFFNFKAGLVAYLHVPRRERTLKIVGTDRSNLSIIRDFYISLGMIENVTLTRIFAPDEDLFAPYFLMVSGLLPRVIKDDKISKIFGQALDYYQDDDYQHCISTLGLIAEDYLQRIYTTLLREQVVGGLTLGQTLDLLHKNTEALFTVAKPSLRSVDPIYELIKSIDIGSDPKSLKSILRDIASLIKDDRIFYNKKLEDIVKTHSRQTPFPVRITDNLNELLKWRNAASHNSRIPLGAHEADRTLYCLVSLITWWQNQLTTQDWSKSKLEILTTLIQEAKLSNQK